MERDHLTQIYFLHFSLQKNKTKQNTKQPKSKTRNPKLKKNQNK